MCPSRKTICAIAYQNLYNIYSITHMSLQDSDATFFSRFFIVWEIKYIKSPNYLTEWSSSKTGVTHWAERNGPAVVQIIREFKKTG